MAEKYLQSAPPNLRESVLYSLTAPGKRIRPRFCLETAEIFDVPRPMVLPVAVALEMIHCFTLIHDDLPCLDDDDERRGRPSNHKVFGEGLALLAGDSLFSMSWDAFAESAVLANPSAYFQAEKIFRDAVGPRGVMGGQAAEALLHAQSKLEDLVAVHRGKTGALFVASVLVPLALSGRTPGSRDWDLLDDFSHAVGVAFQIADDLEDLEAENSAPARKSEAQNTQKEALPLTEQPHHILHYWKEEEARENASTPLRRALSRLEITYGKKAQNLIDLGKEVLQKLDA